MMMETPFQVEETVEEGAKQEASPVIEEGMNPEELRAARKQLLEEAVEETVLRQQQAMMSEEIKFKHQQRVAALFARSGYFADLKGGDAPTQIARAVVKIQLGEAMGLTPMESMQSVYMVNGRPTVDAQVRAARMKRCGYDWDILKHDAIICRLAIKKGGKILTREDGSPCIVEFSMEDAKRAGLLAKETYKQYPLNMLFARAITNAQRWYAPEVLNGANPLDPSEVAEVERQVVQPIFARDKEGA